MSRKPDPERIYRSRRDAVLSRLLGTGMDRAEARVAAWEARADAGGQTRHSAAYWDRAAERTETHGAAAPALRPDHDPRGPRRAAERERPGSHRLTLAQRIRVLAGPFPAGWPLCARQVRADPRSPPRRRCRRRSGGRSTPGRRARTGARRAGRDRPRTRRPRRRSRPSRAVDAGAVASRTFTSSSGRRGPGRATGLTRPGPRRKGSRRGRCRPDPGSAAATPTPGGYSAVPPGSTVGGEPARDSSWVSRWTLQRHLGPTIAESRRARTAAVEDGGEGEGS